MLIRGEEPADIPAIRRLVENAFGRADEARLVEWIRDDGDAVISGVAVEDDSIVGHVLFSPMRAPFKALGLAPLAVAPSRQRGGIGSRLVRWGMDLAERGGWQGVFVLGDPRYYGRFGFEPALASGFTSAYAGPHLMASAFGKSLPVNSGVIDYASAFARLDG